MSSKDKRFSVVLVNRQTGKPTAAIVQDAGPELAKGVCKHFNRLRTRKVIHLRAYVVPIL